MQKCSRFRNKSINEEFTNLNQNCGANIPLYILNAKPIIINIDKYNENIIENEEEDIHGTVEKAKEHTTSEYAQVEEVNYGTMEESTNAKNVNNTNRMVITSNTNTNTITSNIPINDLLKLKKGNKINIFGTLINNSETFTIAKTPTKTELVLVESIPYFRMMTGLITITLSGTNENEQLFIFNKEASLKRLKNIDGLTEINEKQIDEIDRLKSEIVMLKKNINEFENLISSYEDDIETNKRKILDNKMLTHSKSDYLKFMNVT